MNYSINQIRKSKHQRNYSNTTVEKGNSYNCFLGNSPFNKNVPIALLNPRTNLHIDQVPSKIAAKLLNLVIYGDILVNFR